MPDREPEDEALFNIGIVARMTDIQESTLRVWERRYDFPQSARSSGGQRLYSQQEIRRLKWVKQRVDEGMQVSKAIQALQHAERKETFDAALQPLQFAHSRPEAAALTALQDQLRETLFAHDAVGSNSLLNEAVIRYPMENIILEVVGPLFHSIGEAWHVGKIDVATEHFATNILRQNLLIWWRSSPPAFHVAPVMLACAPTELHEGSLLMLGVLLQRLRWPTLYLGQTVPLENLARFVQQVQPSVIVFVAMTDQTARLLSAWPEYMPEAANSGHPVIGYGGKGFVDHPELATQVPGILLGNTLREGLDHLNNLLHDINPVLR